MGCNSINRDMDKRKKMKKGKELIAKKICVEEINDKKKKQKRENNRRDGNEY